MDEDGYVYIVDRTKDMILCSGYNVYPRVIEEAIYEYPGVEEVSVIGIQDAYRGQAPKAFSKLKAGAEAGADAASWIMLRLPQEVSALWQEWLAENAPGRAARIMARLREMHGGKDYDSRWGHRMRGEGHYAEMVAQRFRKAARRLGLDAPQPPLRCDLFRPPERAGDQLNLF